MFTVYSILARRGKVSGDILKRILTFQLRKIDRMEHNKKSLFDKIRDIFWPFFWFVAGSNERILRNCPSNEKDKHFGYGMLIILTTITAMVSGFFAFSLILKDGQEQTRLILTTLIAILWGVIIFNLDRVMVSTMRKYPVGQKAKELVPVLPRIFLAIVIAVVISKPLEITLLEDQIKEAQELNRDSIIVAAFDQRWDKIDSDRGFINRDKTELEGLEAKYNDFVAGKDARLTKFDQDYNNCFALYRSLQGEIDDNASRESNLINIPKFLETYQETYTEEGDTIPKTRTKTRLNNAGLVERDRLRAINTDLRERRASLNCRKFLEDKSKFKQEETKMMTQKINTKTQNINLIDSTLKEEIKQTGVDEENAKNAVIRSDNNFFGYLDDLGNLRKENRNIFWASNLLMLLFFIIETAPIFTKWISNRGTYDDLLDETEQKIRDEIIIDSAQRQQNREYIVQIGNINLQQSIESESTANQELLQKVISAQSELAEKMIEEWKQLEIEKMNEDRESYINSHISKP